MVMEKAADIFNEEIRQRISQAVAEAEKKTGGEIVPAVATSSGRYDRAEDIFGFVISLAALSAFWFVFCPQADPGDYGAASWRTSLPLPGALLVLLVSFTGGAALATWIPALSLPFITKAEMASEVERGAAAAFHNLRAHGTSARTGVLVYVSLYEHMVRVLVDDAVIEKIPQEEWEKVAGLVTEGMSFGDPAGGMISAINRCGELLSGPFPRPAGDVDELSNELRILG